MTRPPPQPGLLPALLPGPPRAPPRGAPPAGEGRGRRARGSARRPPAPQTRPLLSGTRPRVGRRLGGGAAGSRRLLRWPNPGARGRRTARRAAGTRFQVPSARLRVRSSEWQGVKPCSGHRTETPLSRGRPLQSPSIHLSPPGPRGSGQGPVHRRKPARPGLRPQTEDLRGGLLRRAAAGRGLQAACGTPWQLGTPGGACRGGCVAPSI